MNDFSSEDIEAIERAMQVVNENDIFLGSGELIKIARKNGFKAKDIAELCGITTNSVTRWASVDKKTNQSKAKSSKFKHLVFELAFLSGLVGESKYIELSQKLNCVLLEDATLEDLRVRANQLGFKVTYTEI